MSTGPHAGHQPPSTDLADAVALETSGRLAEAIDAFTRLYERDPGGELGGHILRLRHTLAAQTRSLPRPDWPPRMPDPFPGSVSPPEVGPGDVDGVVLGGSILHHGCLIVRQLLDEEQAVGMLELATRALDARDHILTDRATDGDRDWYQEFPPGARRAALIRPWVQEAGGMLTADAPPVLIELITILHRSGLVRAISEYLGERPAISFDKSVLRRVTTSAPTWHQDGSFLGSDVRTVDLWIALTACGPNTSAPGLDIVPRRFDDLLETQTHGAVFPNSIGQGLVEEVAGGRRWVSPSFSPGDAILFDERFVHRTGIGDFTAERVALETWCFAPSTFPKAYVPIAL